MRISDWSSDVCSSDLVMIRNLLYSASDRSMSRRGQAGFDTSPPDFGGRLHYRRTHLAEMEGLDHLGHDCLSLRFDESLDRQSVVWGKSVSVREDLGGGRIIKKKSNVRNGRLQD